MPMRLVISAGGNSVSIVAPGSSSCRFAGDLHTWRQPDCLFELLSFAVEMSKRAARTALFPHHRRVAASPVSL